MDNLEQKKQLLNTQEYNMVLNLSNHFRISFDQALVAMIQCNGDYNKSYQQLDNANYLFCFNENDRLRQDMVTQGIIPPQIGLDYNHVNYSNDTMRTMLANEKKKEEETIRQFFDSIEPIVFN